MNTVHKTMTEFDQKWSQVYFILICKILCLRKCYNQIGRARKRDVGLFNSLYGPRGFSSAENVTNDWRIVNTVEFAPGSRRMELLSGNMMQRSSFIYSAVCVVQIYNKILVSKYSYVKNQYHMEIDIYTGCLKSNRTYAC